MLTKTSDFGIRKSTYIVKYIIHTTAVEVINVAVRHGFIATAILNDLSDNFDLLSLNH